MNINEPLIDINELLTDISEAPRAPRTVHPRQKYRQRLARREKGRAMSTATRFAAPDDCVQRVVTNCTPYLIENAVDRIADEGLAYTDAQVVGGVVRVRTKNRREFPDVETFALAMERATHGRATAKRTEGDALVVDLLCE